MRANKGALLMLSVAVAAVVSLEVETPKKKVEVARGSTATLPCTFRSAETSMASDFGVWKKISSNEEFVNWYFDGGKDLPYIGATYKNRVSLSGNPSGNNLTITLSDVTMDDNGTYECSVRMRHDPPVKSVQMDLFVLVAPSIPECKIIGTTMYGHNINLTCNSQEGSPKPQYSWQRFDVQNQQKELTGAVASGGVLTLKNVSADTSGYYICTSTNSVGKESCNMTVSISPPSMNIGLYAGIIGGIAAAIIVIGIIAYCCCCRKRKDEMTEKENGYQPPQNEPVQIRGPAEEEIQDDEEEEQQEEDRWK